MPEPALSELIDEIAPQLVIASVLKTFFHFGGQPLYALAFGGVSLFVAGLLALLSRRLIHAPGPSKEEAFAAPARSIDEIRAVARKRVP